MCRIFKFASECKKLCHKYTESAELSLMDYPLKKTSPLWRGNMPFQVQRSQWQRWFSPLQQLLSASCCTEARAEVMLAICFLATHLPPVSRKHLWADSLTTGRSALCKDYQHEQALGWKGVLYAPPLYSVQIPSITPCSTMFKEIVCHR